MTLFEWLEGTALAQWVGESIWAYPILISLHAIGLAVVVGIFIMRDLWLLGAFPRIEPRDLLMISKLGWYGFAVNATSGVLLFLSQAAVFAESTPFLIKITLITLAAGLAVYIQRRLSNASRSSVGDVVEIPKVLVGTSLITWLCVIVAGRLIAYL